MRIAVVVGTRPEAIKMAPLILRLNERGAAPVICATGQHGAMLDQALSAFGIEPDHDLKAMTRADGLAGRTAFMLDGLAGIFSDDRPDLVLVQGDTASTLAGALAAHYLGIPAGHVEAGLRTGDPARPWPEEGNRKAVAALAQLHFAPTEGNRRALLREGVAPETIAVTGNTVIDAVEMVVERLKRDRPLRDGLARRFSYLDSKKKLVLVTAHRRENMGEGLGRICEAAAAIGRRGDCEVLFVAHLNPAVREPVRAILGGALGVHIEDALDYAAFLYLMTRADALLTDSGGLQEEALSLGKRVVVARDLTERQEGLDGGAIALAGTSVPRMLAEIERALTRESSTGACANPFGDGQAAARIVDAIERWRAVGRLDVSTPAIENDVHQLLGDPRRGANDA